MKIFFLIFAFISISITLEYKKEVAILDSENFNKITKNNYIMVMVNFCEAENKDCKIFDPTYQYLAN